MILEGVVTNVTAFGAFVDVGVHNDGLVHVSQLADKFVKDPSEVVKVGQKLTVRVLEVDNQRKRIALSARPPAPKREGGRQQRRGDQQQGGQAQGQGQRRGQGRRGNQRNEPHGNGAPAEPYAQPARAQHEGQPHGDGGGRREEQGGE